LYAAHDCYAYNKALLSIVGSARESFPGWTFLDENQRAKLGPDDRALINAAVMAGKRRDHLAVARV